MEKSRRPEHKRVVSGMIGLGRRDVWKPMGLSWNLAIKAKSSSATDFSSTSLEMEDDRDGEM